MHFKKINTTTIGIIALLLLNTVTSKFNPKKLKFKKFKLPSKTSSKSQCQELKNLRPHKLISIDFPDPKSFNFIIQQIRHLQRHTNCHGALVTPFTLLNFLYHHSTGRYSLDCIGRVLDRKNSVCLSQFLKNTRWFSGRKNDLGSELLKKVHLKVSKLYADVMLVYKMSASV